MIIKRISQNTPQVTCWFCQNTFDANLKLCPTKSCKEHFVIYQFEEGWRQIKNKVSLVQFKTICGTHHYYINYHILGHEMEVIEQINLPPEPNSTKLHYELKRVFVVPYQSIILTPQNAESKLPLLITFS